MTSFFDSLGSRPARRGAAQAAWLRRAGKSGFAESTLQEVAWQRKRGAAVRWAVAGGLLGALVALLVFAPAAWLARAVASFTNDRVLLTDARGSIWNGSAVAVLSGGPDSRSASALPGRISWTVKPGLTSMDLLATHACCINGTLTLRVQPGLTRSVVSLVPTSGQQGVGQWPTAWLMGLGTPWNTVQPGGTMRLTSPGFSLEQSQGRLRFIGDATLDINGMSSRLSTLPMLGTYRVAVKGDAASGGNANVTLTTLQGPLEMKGYGQWAGGDLKFRGEATAAEGQQEALNNLLNIIGRRQGGASIISIG
jgi:general secretion pathway protein N